MEGEGCILCFVYEQSSEEACLLKRILENRPKHIDAKEYRDAVVENTNRVSCDFKKEVEDEMYGEEQ